MICRRTIENLLFGAPKINLITDVTHSPVPSTTGLEHSEQSLLMGAKSKNAPGSLLRELSNMSL